MPVLDDTNQITFTAEDFWGNVSTTNITVSKSAMQLTIDPVDENTLKAGVNRQNLFVLSATARQATGMNLILNLYHPWEEYENPPDGIVWTDINPGQTAISIGALGKLGSDGLLYKGLPDNAPPIDVTPRVDGEDYYTWNEPDPQEYKPYITANTLDLRTNTPEFCVGQKVTFTLKFDPPLTYVDIVSRWNLPEKYVNHPWQNQTYIPGPNGTDGYYQSYGSINYDIADNLLENTNQTSCWYVNGKGGSVSIGPSIIFPNGHYATLAAMGKFKIYRPSVTFGPDPLWPAPMTVMITNGWLELGNDLNGYGIVAFEATVTSKVNFLGQANWTQL